MEIKSDYEGAAQKGGGRELDSEFAEKQHERAYNPVDEAQRGTVSSTLNDQAGKQRYGVSNGN